MQELGGPEASRILAKVHQGGLKMHVFDDLMYHLKLDPNLQQFYHLVLINNRLNLDSCKCITRVLRRIRVLAFDGKSGIPS